MEKNDPCPFWTRPWYIWDDLRWWEKVLSRLWGWTYPRRRCGSCYWCHRDPVHYAPGYAECQESDAYGFVKLTEGCRRWTGGRVMPKRIECEKDLIVAMINRRSRFWHWDNWQLHVVWRARMLRPPYGWERVLYLSLGVVQINVLRRDKKYQPLHSECKGANT